MKRKSSIEMALDYLNYARRYDCTVIEAIADRDWPLLRSEIIAILAALNIPATEDTIKECHPDSEEQLEIYRVEEYYRDQI